MRTTTLLLMGLALSAAASADDLRNFSKQLPADKSGRVQISNVAGSVTVTGWDKAEVDVQGRLGPGVERVDVTQDGGSTVIKVVLTHEWHNDGTALLEVHVPAGSQIEASTVSAGIAVEGVRGKSRLNSVSGGIRADVAEADVDVKTVSGSIALRGNGQPAQMRASSVSGSVSVAHGAGELEANTTSGSLNASLEPARSVRVRSVSGSVSLHGHLLRGANVEADTVSGSLAVDAAADAGYQYDVSTLSGSISNCFGESSVRSSQYGPGNRLDGKRGAGEGSVRLKSMSGAVSLCDK